jgi:F-type H+-transporting ATPase subunit b
MEALDKLGINFGGIILYIVNFGFLIFIMARFVYRPLVKAIDERRDQIRESLESAEALRLDFAAREERVKSEASATLEAVREEAQRLADRAKQDAVALVAEAEARKEAMLTEAEARVQAMESDILRKVEVEAVTRVAKAVELILQAGVDPVLVKESVQVAWSKKV